MEPRVADTFAARLRGLAFRSRAAVGDTALLLPRTRSVHTFGMRFCLDLEWRDGRGRTLRVDRAVPPRRVRICLRARSVVERPARGSGEQPANRPGRAATGSD